MNLRNLKTVTERRKAIEKELSVDLKNIGSFTLDEMVASSRNCENMIGAAQIPMGIAGPLHGKYIPLATTEGALVASVNRGCKAITESGGAMTSAFRIGATRGVVFRVKGVSEGSLFASFVYSNKERFNKISQTTSYHIKLVDITVKTVGRYAFVRFVFNTQDAMGMNMITLAADAIARVLEKEKHVQTLAVAGNYDIDKKPAWLNFLRGRGWEIRAEVKLTGRVLQTTLKTTPQKMYDVWLAKCMIGSAMAGSIGFNAQYANIIAALFLATGQDPAHVVEGSMGMTTCEIEGDDLYVSVYLPDLMVGTVGGGTGLATQKEALSIIGAKNSTEFAEVVGAAVLAGEISLLASLSEGTLARAHKKLARGGK